MQILHTAGGPWGLEQIEKAVGWMAHRLGPTQGRGDKDRIREKLVALVAAGGGRDSHRGSEGFSPLTSTGGIGTLEVSFVVSPLETDATGDVAAEILSDFGEKLGIAAPDLSTLAERIDTYLIPYGGSEVRTPATRGCLRPPHSYVVGPAQVLLGRT